VLRQIQPFERWCLVHDRPIDRSIARWLIGWLIGWLMVDGLTRGITSVLAISISCRLFVVREDLYNMERTSLG